MGDSVVELTTATAIREAVLAGRSLAFLSDRVVARDLDSGHLVVVPTNSLDLKRVFRRLGRHQAAARRPGARAGLDRPRGRATTSASENRRRAGVNR